VSGEKKKKKEGSGRKEEGKEEGDRGEDKREEERREKQPVRSHLFSCGDAAMHFLHDFLLDQFLENQTGSRIQHLLHRSAIGFVLHTNSEIGKKRTKGMKGEQWKRRERERKERNLFLSMAFSASSTVVLTD
jgi:hypothetical protein